MQTTHLSFGGYPSFRTLFSGGGVVCLGLVFGGMGRGGELGVGDVVNVNFTAHLNAAYVEKVGLAAVGVGEGDVWNVYSRDVGSEWEWRESGVLAGLMDAGGGVTGVGLAVTNAAGFWGSLDADAMYRTYLYSGGGDMTATYRGMGGVYDVYVYAHGAADGQAPELVLNRVDGGDEGWYDVVVSNPYGEVVSEGVWLGVVSGRLQVVRGESGLRVEVSGEAGATYVVEWSVDLEVWRPLVTLFDAPAVWVVPDFVTSGEVERRFYRLRR